MDSEIAKPCLIKNLRDQIIREILSFLDYTDFVHFSLSSMSFIKFLKDPYIQVKIPEKAASYRLDGLSSPMESVIINQYINHQAKPYEFCTKEPEFQGIFHRHENLLYSTMANVIVICEVVPWSLKFLRRESYSLDFVIAKTAAYRDTIIAGHENGLQQISKVPLQNNEYIPHLDIYTCRYEFKKASRISQLEVLNKGGNSICLLDSQEVLVFDSSLRVLCNFRMRSAVTSFHIPSKLGKNYILGFSTGALFLYRTYQSQKQAVEILPAGHIPVTKIRSTRISQKERQIDLIFSFSGNTLMINNKRYRGVANDFDVRLHYLFVINH